MGDPPCVPATEAMRCWPETAAAVAVRRNGADDCEVAAPLVSGTPSVWSCGRPRILPGKSVISTINACGQNEPWAGPCLKRPRYGPRLFSPAPLARASVARFQG
ncbi:hypothetical protein [Aquamicrobium terrae]|uniref:hypothetical protein n=1 Tax=Aquamicrobium terrae TaxID=1324945 RepID=UPI0033987717